MARCRVSGMPRLCSGMCRWTTPSARATWCHWDTWRRLATASSAGKSAASATLPTFLAALTTNNGRSGYQGLQVQYRRRVVPRLPGAGVVRLVSLHRRRFERFLPGVGRRRGERGRQPRIFRLRLAPLFHGRLDLRVSSAHGGSRTASRRLGAGRHAARPDGLSHHRPARTNSTWGSRSPMHSARTWWRAHRSGSRTPTRREEGLNPSAFRSTPSGHQGNLGRNAIEGFGMSQVDLACGASSGWASGVRSSSGWRHSTVSTRRTLRTR